MPLLWIGRLVRFSFVVVFNRLLGFLRIRVFEGWKQLWREPSKEESLAEEMDS